jgi:predicted ribonuclease YlaK
MRASYKQSLIKRFKEFEDRAVSLLEKSSIGPSVNINSSVFLLGAHYPWSGLSQATKLMQTDIYNEYRHLIDIGKTVLAKSLPENKKRYEQECRTILEMIEQTNLTWYKTIQEAMKALKESVNIQIEAMNSVHGRLGVGSLLIPDTNVFIKNPNIHEYRIIERCNIVILPSVLSELDKLKIEHSNANVRKKANIAIRNIKEYRRRGSLFGGVKITDNIAAFSIAAEPKFEGKPGWLDPNNQDDRFLASCFEVASNYPDSEIAIMTSDINMQNKAEFAFFDYLDPDENNLVGEKSAKT